MEWRVWNAFIQSGKGPVVLYCEHRMFFKIVISWPPYRLSAFEGDCALCSLLVYLWMSYFVFPTDSSTSWISHSWNYRIQVSTVPVFCPLQWIYAAENTAWWGSPATSDQQECSFAPHWNDGGMNSCSYGYYKNKTNSTLFHFMNFIDLAVWKFSVLSERNWCPARPVHFVQICL